MEMLSTTDPYAAVARATPLLTRDAERRLAEQLVAGRAAAAQLAADPPPNERPQLAAQVAAGEAALDQLVRANLKLVYKYAHRYRSGGLEWSDLVQEGLAGLLVALEKFDPTTGNKLSTFATWWVRQAMGRAIDEQKSTIRLPVHLQEDLRRLRQVEGLLAMTGEAHDAAAVAAIAHTTRATPTAGTQRTTPQKPWKTEKVEQLRKVRAVYDGALPSLDAEIEDAEGSTLHDILGDPRADPAAAALARVQAQLVVGLLDALDGRQRRIIALRFGLDGHGEQRTLEEVGKVVGLTRERTRQIEAEALRTLRQQAEAVGLEAGG